MRADDVKEAIITRVVAEEMKEDEFCCSRDVTEIETLWKWKKIPNTSVSCRSPTRSAATEARLNSRLATHYACVSAARSLRAIAQNAARRS